MYLSLKKKIHISNLNKNNLRKHDKNVGFSLLSNLMYSIYLKKIKNMKNGGINIDYMTRYTN